MMGTFSCHAMFSLACLYELFTVIFPPVSNAFGPSWLLAELVDVLFQNRQEGWTGWSIGLLPVCGR